MVDAASPFADIPAAGGVQGSPSRPDESSGPVSCVEPTSVWMEGNKCFVLERFADDDGCAGSERIKNMQNRWNRAVDVYLFLLHYKRQTSASGAAGVGSGEAKANSTTSANALDEAVSQFKATWYEKIKDLHTDPQSRHYHTLVHLAEMFGFLDILLPSAASVGSVEGMLSAEVLARQSAAPIRAMLEAVTTMATFFHDAVYDAKSSTNEEDSAELFREFAMELKALVWQDGGSGDDKNAKPRICTLFDCAVSWVDRYIQSTKSHSAAVNGEDGANNGDSAFLGVLGHLDRYLSRGTSRFLDADMAVLAKDSSAYDAYAGLIRKEFIHVPRDVYCEKRAEVLESFLVDPTGNDKFVFATDKMRNCFESRARENLRNEIALLRAGVIPCEDTEGAKCKITTEGGGRGADDKGGNGCIEDGQEDDAKAASIEDRPEASVVVEEEKTDASNEPALAPGWEALLDPNSGKEYYYNSQTGETAWERPVDQQEESDVPRDESIPVGEGDVATESNAGGEDPVTDSLVDSIQNQEDDHEELEDPVLETFGEEDLPEGWNEVYDVLVAANESSGNLNEIGTKVEETSEEEQKPLPADNVDSDAGDVFSQPAPDVDNPVAGTFPVVTDNVDGVDPESVDRGVEDTADPFPRELPSDALPASAFDGPPPDNADEEIHAAADVAVSSSTDDAPSDVPGLPMGWAELYDESSGQTYYYNEKSGITSWDRPATSASGNDSLEEPSSPSSDLSGNGGDEVETETESLEDVPTSDVGDGPAGEKEQAQEEPARLPAGWEELVDPTSGASYYYCTIDGTTSWQRPEA